MLASWLVFLQLFSRKLQIDYRAAAFFDFFLIFFKKTMR